jgi:twitching motility protein PilT
MDDDIYKKMDEGRVSPMEAYLKAIDKKRFIDFIPEEQRALAMGEK